MNQPDQRGTTRTPPPGMLPPNDPWLSGAHRAPTGPSRRRGRGPDALVPPGALGPPIHPPAGRPAGSGPGAATNGDDAAQSPRPSLLSRMTLKTRITLLVTVAVGLAVAIVSAVAYFNIQTRLWSQRDQSLLNRAQSVASVERVAPGQVGLTRDVTTLMNATGVQITLVNENGVARSSMPGGPPPLGQGDEIAVANGDRAYSLRTVTIDGSDYRQAAVPSADPSAGVAVVLTESIGDTQAILARLRFVLFLVGLFGVAAAAALGAAVARAGLRPVNRLTRATEHIARTEELRPITVTGHDELGRLAYSFNSMLAALELSRQRQRRLVADAGHELRTPLTSLRTNLDLLAQSFSGSGPGLAQADRDELLADVRAQVEELTLLVKDVVELARDSSSSDTFEHLDFATVVERAVERARRRAPNLEFDVRLEPWPIVGDATALERAVVNLLDNAAKWSPDHGTVGVTLSRGTLTVTDQGPGISDEDLPHVFERFYRATNARDMPGSGLGLAIVWQAAERHAGTVRAARSPEGGAMFTLSLPAAPPRPVTGTAEQAP